MFAAQAIVLGLAVAWQAGLQDAPHLFVTAGIALVVKGGIIPMALHRIVRRLEIHREIEQVIGGGPVMLVGLGVVALSIMLVFRSPARSTRWRARTSPSRSPSSCSVS